MPVGVGGSDSSRIGSHVRFLPVPQRIKSELKIVAQTRHH